jgi:hypothetical protein
MPTVHVQLFDPFTAEPVDDGAPLPLTAQQWWFGYVVSVKGPTCRGPQQQALQVQVLNHQQSACAHTISTRPWHMMKL